MSTAQAPRPASEIPGPRAPRALQTWLGIARPIETRLTVRRRYGPVFQSRDLIIGRMFHIADRDLVEQMFKWKPDQYEVAEPRELMAPVVGSTSILLLDGASHMRMRKLMLPPFHGRAIARYAELVERLAADEVARWRPGQTVRMRSVAQRVTMEVIIRAVFGITEPGRVAELARMLPRLSSPNPLLLLLRRDNARRGPWARLIRDRDRLDAMLFEEIATRRESAERDDILSLLLAVRDEDGAALTDREIRDELVTMLLAGHETTATSIAWAFERLLRTPSALERLTAEVAAGDGDGYLDAVIKETLRVRPVVTEVFRAPTDAIELGGWRFAPGAHLVASLILVHYDPELYGPDPEAFRPERFLEGASDGYTWVPFGGGVRRCLGAAFALLEMRAVIATVLRHARLRAPRQRDERARFRGITVVPSRGGEVVVEELLSPSR